MKSFPEKFFWGAATASYQVEGYNENTDWAKAAKEGKVPFAGRLADHYHRFEGDFDIAKELGHNAHRFSVEWSRIEPQEGEFDQNEIEHYRTVLKALRKRKITPFVTLWHFTLPLWFSETGGFERKDSPEIFARYCAKVVSELGDLCEHFSTMNEPNVYASNGWLRGTWPPFKHFSLIDAISITNSGRKSTPYTQTGFRSLVLYFRVLNHLALAHNASYVAMKKVNADITVSVVKHVIYFHANWNPLNKILAWVMNRLWTHRFMKRVVYHCDEIGLNYYFHKKFGDRATYDKTDMDWDIYPEGLYGALRLLHRYRKPIQITEAGIADQEDVHRAQYIQTQIRATHKALEEGIDVRGHMYWSLMDNYEWALGTKKRFGLVAINYETLERTIRPSAHVYKKIIENNGIIE